ncbi:hypothetical protein ID866_9352 [Astraeus odoratus]|nr:hypothetical protein ID866_9352 [Astraeus odoratus]
MAKDHITLWLPHPEAVATHSTNIPADTQDRVKSVTLHAWAKSTRASYRAGLLVFHIFCDPSNIPDYDRAPASSDLIAHFISSLVGYYSDQTTQGYVLK